MIRMTHHDDGKEKWNSHELRFKCVGDDRFKDFPSSGGYCSDYHLDEIFVTGESVEDALQSLDEIMNWLHDQYEAIFTAYKNGELQKNIMEVDWKGDPV